MASSVTPTALTPASRAGKPPLSPHNDHTPISSSGRRKAVPAPLLPTTDRSRRSRGTCANPFSAIFNTVSWAAGKVSDALSSAQSLFSTFSKTDTGRATLTFAPTAAGLVIKVASDAGILSPSTRTAATIVIMTTGLVARVFNTHPPSEEGLKESFKKDPALWAHVLRTGVALSGTTTEPTVQLLGLGMKAGALALHSVAASQLDPASRPISLTKQSAHIIGGLADTLEALGLPVGTAGRIATAFSDNLYLTDSMSTAYTVPRKGFQLSPDDLTDLREDTTPLYAAAGLTAFNLPALLDATPPLLKPEAPHLDEPHGRRMAASNNDSSGDITMHTCDGTTTVRAGGGSNMTEPVTEVTGRITAQSTDITTTEKAENIIVIKDHFEDARTVISGAELSGDVPSTIPKKEALIVTSSRQGTRIANETRDRLTEGASSIAKHYGIGADKQPISGTSISDTNLQRVNTVFDTEATSFSDACKAAEDDSGDFDDPDICDAIGTLSLGEDSLQASARATGTAILDEVTTFSDGVKTDADEQFRLVSESLGMDLDVQHDLILARENAVSLSRLQQVTDDASSSFEGADTIAANLKARMQDVATANRERVVTAQETLNQALTLQDTQRQRLSALFSTPPSQFECGLEKSEVQVGLAIFSGIRAYMEIHVPFTNGITCGRAYGRYLDKTTSAHFTISVGEQGLRTATLTVTKTDRHSGEERERGKEITTLAGPGLHSTSMAANLMVTGLRALFGASVRDAFEGEKAVERSGVIMRAAIRHFQPGGNV